MMAHITFLARMSKHLARLIPHVCSLAMQLGEKDTRVEFDIMFEELQAWKDKYHTTLVPKQVI